MLAFCLHIRRQEGLTVFQARCYDGVFGEAGGTVS
jgi:hypothetical protein